MFIEIKNRYKPVVTSDLRRRMLVNNLSTDTLERLRYANLAWANSEGVAVMIFQDGTIWRSPPSVSERN